MSFTNFYLRGLLAVQRADVVPSGIRVRLLRMAGACVAPDVVVAGGVRITGQHLTIEAGAFVNSGAIIDAAAPLLIGAEVHVAPGAIIVTSTHAIGTSLRRAGPATATPIAIGAGSWIGAGAIILPGVTVAPGCIVAAGTVVTRSTKPNGIYAGIPARLLRQLS